MVTIWNLSLWLFLFATLMASPRNINREESFEMIEMPKWKMSLFSDNDGKGDLVCDLEWDEEGATWNLKKWEPCENDEARSVIIQNAVKGTKIEVYDSPYGNPGDDYTVIKVLKDITNPILLNTFEENLTTEFLDVTFYADTFIFANGLDGKVSEIVVDTSDIGVDGVWSDWEEWSGCSKTCDEGVTVRWRTCNNPAPAYGGNQCEGPRTEKKKCLVKSCAINGGWSHFSEWSTCSETCDVGRKVRTRTCSNPKPQFGGEECRGEDKQVQSCVEIENCPINGGWSDYSEWSPCSETCGAGKKSRYRTCTNPIPQFGGEECQGEHTETESCVLIENCPINGGWSEFSDWSHCSKTCGVGSKERSRTCSNPKPLYGGEECQGVSKETENCVLVENCPIPGGWGAWTEFGECSASCGMGEKTRTRLCDNPLPQYGGETCQGDLKDSMECSQLTYCVGSMILYSDNDGQDELCELSWNHEDSDWASINVWNFRKDAVCENNEARSLVISQANAGTTISFYDDPEGSRYNDYTMIKIKKDITERLIIPTFEKSFNNELVDVHFENYGLFGIEFLGDGLDGEVSNVLVVTP